MVSEEIHEFFSNNYTIFGLKEYNEFKKGEPLKVVIGIHDIGMDRESLRDICLNICNANSNIIAITFDLINHGVRKYPSDTSNSPFFKNQNFNVDLWGYSQEATNVIHLLINASQDVLFYPIGSYPVKEWCLLGHGLGGISCVISAVKETRISTVITIDSTFEILDWMELLVKKHEHDIDMALSNNLKKLVFSYLEGKDRRLQNKNMLMINNKTGEDYISSHLISLNHSFLHRMFELRQREYRDKNSGKWKMVITNRQTKQPVDYINDWFKNSSTEYCKI